MSPIDHRRFEQMNIGQFKTRTLPASAGHFRHGDQQ